MASESKVADFGQTVPAAEFPAYVAKLAETPNEYASQLAKLGQVPTAVLVPMYNPSIVGKNRYLNVLPSEQHRVKLKSKPTSDPYGDYINASHFKSSLPGAIYQYIATQAPIEASFGDFWHMVWEQGSKMILMLTKHEENSVAKADLYWSESDEAKQYGDITVKLLKHDDSNKEHGLVVRSFQLTHGNQVRAVTHVHFTAWPDHGAPQEMEHLVTLFRVYRKLRREIDPQSKAAEPIVVHCSAGVGRTGSFILIDTVLDNLGSQQPQPINIMKSIKELRQHRPMSIESRDQYEFVHRFLAHCVQNKLLFL